MFRRLWSFPLYAPSSSVATAAVATESWAFPVDAHYHSSHTFVRGPEDIVEFGHKEVTS